MRSGAQSTLLGVCVLLVAARVPAQESRASRLATAMAAAAPGSLVWLERGCELVEAQCDFDVRLAMRTATGMWDAAVASEVPGAAATIAAVVARVVVMGEGPAAATEWRQRAADLPRGTPPSLRVFYFVSRARTSCACNNHIDEVAHVAEARAAAKETAEVGHRFRANQAGHSSNARHNVAVIRRLLDEAAADGRGAEVDHLLAALHLEARRAAESIGDAEAAAAAETALAECAERTGSPRLRGELRVFEGNRLAMQGRTDEAIAQFRMVADMMAKVGDLVARYGAVRAQAFAAMRGDDFEAAADLLDECDELLAGRGAMFQERDVLGLRLDLARRLGDRERFLALNEECAHMDAAADEITIHAAQAHARAREAEAERADAERRLVAEQVRVRTIGGIGLAVGLGAIALVSWRSRRRLLRANARLAEQIRAVEQSRAAQARLEERMRQLERTETLGTMAAGIAHDFNNLLTSILGSAEMLANRRDGEVGELAQAILLAGEQASRLCRQMQAYAGGSPSQLAAVDLVAMAREMLPSLHAALRGQVDVQLHPANGTVTVNADRSQMEQVLLNLVVNARDARAAHIRIEIGRRDDANAADSRHAALTVVDDGDGMTAEVQQRIFDPFFTTRFPGRGLGLAVVHGIVRRHAGTIQVKSAPGSGSRFTIELPSVAADEPVVVVPTPPVETEHLAPDFAVLAVDDDPSVRMLLARFFDRLSAHAMVAENGFAAIDAVAGLVPTRRVVAFVDLTMPEMDGVEVVRRLRGLRPDVSIVVMSGHPPDYVEQVARGLGADHVLGKPFTFDAVRAVLAAIAREQSAGVGRGKEPS